MLTTDLDDPGYGWNRSLPTTGASRSIRQLWSALDGRNLATDQTAFVTTAKQPAQPAASHAIKPQVRCPVITRKPTHCKTVASQTTPVVLWLFKEVLIDLFEHEGLFDDNAAVMLDHERGKVGAVDEHQAGVDPFGIVNGLGTEA
jgi:hypothetical protein